MLQSSRALTPIFKIYSSKVAGQHHREEAFLRKSRLERNEWLCITTVVISIYILYIHTYCRANLALPFWCDLK